MRHDVQPKPSIERMVHRLYLASVGAARRLAWFVACTLCGRFQSSAGAEKGCELPSNDRRLAAN
jgi:hypothetical protein